jgi:hypothetical protein
MKTLQQLCAATALLFVLSLSAVGGTIHTDAVPPPPPPPPVTATATTDAQVSTVPTESTVESETLIAEITLHILQLLSVF